MPAIVRTATDADLEAVTGLWRGLLDYHHELDALTWTVAGDGPERIRAWYAEALTADDRLLLVAEDDGEIVGYVHGVLGDGPPPLLPRRAANVTDLAVRPSHRRRGIGRALMDALAAQLAARGAVEIKLSVAVANAGAIALYEALGFKPLLYTMRKVLEGDG